MNSTPGPWKVNRVPIKSCGGSNTCFKIEPIKACLYDDYQAVKAGICTDENKANAKLIAAAPDLLDACKSSCNLCLMMHNGKADCTPCVIGKAINKAKGE